MMISVMLMMTRTQCVTTSGLSVCVRQSDIDDDTRGNDDGSDTKLNTDDDNRLVGENASVVKCIFRRGKCVTHGCDTKSFKVSVKKWQWIDRRKEYGYVSSKTTRYICLNMVEGRLAPGMASSSSGIDVSQQQHNVGVEVGRIFSEEKTISTTTCCSKWGARL